jgi:hypothetical protein
MRKRLGDFHGDLEALKLSGTVAARRIRIHAETPEHNNP